MGMSTHRGPGIDDEPRNDRGQFRPGVSGNAKGRSVDHDWPVGDSWESELTGIGDPSRDKRLAAKYQSACVDYQTVCRLWETNATVAKAIELPGAECFREGYEIQIPDEQKYGTYKEDVEQKLEDLGVDAAIEKAWSIKRAHGGSAILLGTNDSRRLDEPVKPASVQSLDWLNVFEPIELVPDSLYSDPAAAKYGQPEFYRLNTLGTIGSSYQDQQTAKDKARRKKLNSSKTQLIHESRLIVFQGIKVSNYIRSMNTISQHWGIGIVPRFIDALRDHDVGMAGLAILATDSSQPVITIEGLREMAAKNEHKLAKRMRAIEMSRSIARAILLDPKEKYERQTTNLQGIPDVADRLSIRLASDVDIPLSVLLGYSPAAMGKPDNSEQDKWFNFLRSIQRRQLTPPLRTIISLATRGLRERKIPKKYLVKWHELERLNDERRANMYLTMARVDSMNVKSGMITSTEGRRSRFVGGFSLETQVDESKEAPGFLAPLPTGVMPPADPAAKIVTSKEAGLSKVAAGAAVKPGLTTHTVGGYARRNPTGSGTEPAAKQGGDVAPRVRDHLSAVMDALEAAGMLGAGARDLIAKMTDGDGCGVQIEYAGFQVVIENARGSEREWIDTDGTRGKTRMRYDYGYLAGSKGADGDSVDVYLGPSPEAQWVYVIHQNRKQDGFATYDEDKVMLGFDSPNHARDAYLAQYDDERFFRGMSQMTVGDFRARLIESSGGAVTNEDVDDTEDGSVT